MNTKEIQEQLKDVQGVTLDLQERLTGLENQQPINMDQQDLVPLLKEINWLKDLTLIQQQQSQDYFKSIDEKLDTMPKKETRNFRVLLFPEKDPQAYYAVVRRLLRWGALIVALTCFAILGGMGLAVYQQKLQNADDQRYTKAWEYLEQRVSPKTLKAMNDALDKTK